MSGQLQSVHDVSKLRRLYVQYFLRKNGYWAKRSYMSLTTALELSHHFVNGNPRTGSQVQGSQGIVVDWN